MQDQQHDVGCLSNTAHSFHHMRLVRSAGCFLPGGLSFWLVGYAFAFGEGNPFIGFSGFASIGMSHSEFTSVFFQVSANEPL